MNPPEGGDMGKKETSLIDYYDKAEYFAKLLNGWIFAGEEVIRPDQIFNEDRRFTGQTKFGFRERYRDIYKRISDVHIQLLIGVELQSYVDYLMSLRAMDYEVLAYLDQVKEIRRRHVEAKDLKGDEYLSGFAKKDRLLPVITLILYLGEAPWDGGKSLHELLNLDQTPRKLRRFVENHHLHVLDICHTPDERLRKFAPDLSFMFLFFKKQKDKKALKELMEETSWRLISDDTYNAIADYTKEPQLLEIKEKYMEEGGINMCQALRELIADGKLEGERCGEERVSKLTLLLIGEKRYEDLERASKEKEFRNQLFRDFGI